MISCIESAQYTCDCVRACFPARILVGGLILSEPEDVRYVMSEGAYAATISPESDAHR